jgi:tetratricopeptide (TPR) repeat protein
LFRDEIYFGMLMKTLRLFILLLICSCTGQNLSFDNAKKLIKEKDYKGAIEILNKILKEKPTFDTAYIERAYAYMMIGDIRNSFNDYDRAMLNPLLRISALDGRASLNYHTGDYQKAVEDLSKIIEKDPNNFHAYYGRGMAKTRLKIYGSDPDSTSRWSGRDERGVFYNDNKAAMIDFNKAIELNPKFTDSYVKRGNLYRTLVNDDKALEDFNTAIKTDPNNFVAYINRALLYKDLKNVSAAMADFEIAIKLEPNNPYPYINRGYLKKEQLNDKDGACNDIRKAKSLGFELSEEDLKYCD